MRHRSGRGLICAVALISAALLAATGRVSADDTISVGFNTSVPTAYVTYTTNSSGGTSTVDAYIGPFTSITDSQNPSYLPSSNGFCIDLWHDMSGGQSFQGTVVHNATNIGSESGYFPYPSDLRVSDPTLTKDLNYLGLVYNSLKGLTGGAYNDAMGAVQLSIWNLIDKHFAVSNVGNDPHGNLLTDFNAINGLLNGQNETIEGLSLVGYSNSQSGSYPGSTLITVDRSVTSPTNQSTQYQNIIMWGGNSNVLATPEPSTLAIGGFGALAFLWYGLKRRKASLDA